MLPRYKYSAQMVDAPLLCWAAISPGNDITSGHNGTHWVGQGFSFHSLAYRWWCWGNALFINPADNLSSTTFTTFAKLRALRALAYCKLSWEWFSLSPGWNSDEEECWMMSPITGHQLIIGHRRFTSCSHIHCNSRWITNNLLYIPKTSLTEIFWRCYWAVDFGLR